MVKVNFLGAFFGPSGYSQHLRNLALATARLNPDTSVETPLFDGWEKNASDAEYSLLRQPKLSGGWQVLVTSPLNTYFKLSELNKGVLPFMVFEGDKAPKQWKLIADLVPKVLVPSNHCKDALFNAGVTEDKIVVVPHGVNLEVYNPQVTPDVKLVSEKCTFFWNKGWSKGVHDRSGFHTVLKCFLEEFKEESGVRLVAHINPAYNAPNWNINEELDKAGLTPLLAGKKCEVLINSTLLPDSALAQMYNASDYYIGITRADGFNLPVLESMACGTPVLISDFGGQTDYARDCCVGEPVSGRLVPAPITDFMELPLYEATNWLELDEACLRKVLRDAFVLWQNDKAGYDRLSERGVEVAKSNTWEHTARVLLKVLEDLENGKEKK